MVLKSRRTFPINIVRKNGGPNNNEEDKVLTHCKLNWRGAAFTYLYRINVLGENEQAAQKDLMAIWHPNPTWFAFMNEVIAHYNEVNGKEVAMSFEAADPENH